MGIFDQLTDTKLATVVLTPMVLKKKAVGGVFFLGLKRFLLQFISTGSNIILARILFPEDFGAFAIALGLVSFWSIFASLGLEKALIQKKTNLTKGEIQSTFFFSILTALAAALLIFVIAPFLYQLYPSQLGKQGISYLRLLSFTLIALSLRNVSVAIIERKIAYEKILIGEVIEMTIMQGLTVFLALKGYGVFSFILGTFFGRFAGALIFYILSPWPLGLNISTRFIRKLWDFGINFQLNTIIGSFNTAMLVLFIGKISGAPAVGFLNWAGGLAAFPRAVSDIVGQMIFPICSRVQDDRLLLRLIIEKSAQFISFAAFPLIALLAALAKPITVLIYTDKWLPGLPAFYFFSLQSILLIFGSIFMQILLALGKARVVRNITLVWVVVQWVFALPLVLIYGYTGLAMAGALDSATLFIAFIKLRKEIQFELLPQVKPYLFLSLFTGLIIFIAQMKYPIESVVGLLFWLCIGAVLYLAIVMIIKGRQIIQDLYSLKKILTSSE